MAEMPRAERWTRLINAVSRLSGVQNMDELVDALRHSTRSIARADGITVVRRHGDQAIYVAEDAVGPLWTGQSFLLDSCIAGVAILARQPILIPDILLDPRVPQAAYAQTFVRSMAVFPIGLGDPSMTLGAYWREPGPIDPEAVSLMTSLARSAGAAVEKIEVLDRAYAAREQLREVRNLCQIDNRHKQSINLDKETLL